MKLVKDDVTKWALVLLTFLCHVSSKHWTHKHAGMIDLVQNVSEPTSFIENILVILEKGDILGSLF